MTEQNIAKKILEKIKQANLKPKPKWQFTLFDILPWFLFTLAVLIGSLATSIIILMTRTNDWDLYGRMGRFFFLKTIPYFWIIILILFLVLAYINFNKTKGGYRYQFYIIILASVIISVVLGVLFYNLGFSENLEFRMQKQVPFYRNVIMGHMMKPQKMMWSNPEEGFLAGQVISITDNYDFIFKDFETNQWHIIATEDSYIHPFRLETDMKLRLLGQKIAEELFEAQEIRPLTAPWMMLEDDVYNLNNLMKENTSDLRIIR